MSNSIIRRHTDHMTLLGRAPGYVHARRLVLQRLAAALPVPILDATRPMLLAWRTAMTYSPAAVCGYVSHARQFYAWAADEGLITASPAVRIPVPAKPRRLPRPIPVDDLVTAITSAPPRIRIWLILAAFCGLRAKEIALLRGENVLLHSADPVLVITWNATKGTTERRVPLCEFAQGEIIAAGLPVRGWAFRRLDGLPGPNAPHQVSHICNNYLRDLQIPATLHQLRHWFGTELQDATGNVLLVAEVMGHSSVESTRIYALVKSRRAAEAVQRLPVPPGLRAAG